MRKKLLVMLLALTLAFSLAVPALAAAEPVVTYGSDRQNYGNWSSQVCAYLFENKDGGLTRVEYAFSTLTVEDYDSGFELLSQRSIEVELPLWGGFYAGKDYNFFVFGQRNKEESDSAEVFRVVKYSKDWQRLGAASLYGANTTVPFFGGSLRFAEAGGYLYIRTCHEMYAAKDGRNHQANLTFSVRIDDMQITDNPNGYKVWFLSSTGYVSHSFNQFILVDSGDRIITLDHGDAFPRAVVLCRFGAPAGQEIFTGDVQDVSLFDIPGTTGNNYTGVTVGGLEETSDGYVAAYTYNGYDGSSQSRDTPTLHLAFVSRDLSSVSTKSVDGIGATTPQLVSTGMDGGYVLWNDNSVEARNKFGYKPLYYARYDSRGNIGEVHSARGDVSDCKPIVYNGKVVWYNSSYAPLAFCTLDETGVHQVAYDITRQFTDLTAGAYYTAPVRWAAQMGIAAGVSSSAFSPDTPCTQAQILTFLWRAAGQPTADGTPLSPAEAGKYYSDAVAWARAQNMLDGGFSAEQPCTRAMAVTWLWRQFGSQNVSGSKAFADVPSTAPFAAAVSWVVENGITGGTSETTFSPDDTCTRAQVVTFLYRASAL